MTFDAVHVSNNILKRSFEDSIPITSMKLQRILYFVVNERAKDLAGNLLHESFEPWKYGPAIRSVYNQFKGFAEQPVSKYAKDAAGVGYSVDETQEPALSSILDLVWANTKNLPAVTLSRIATLEGSAWHKAFTSQQTHISVGDMVDDFSYYHVLGFSRSSPNTEDIAIQKLVEERSAEGPSVPLSDVASSLGLNPKDYR